MKKNIFLAFSASLICICASAFDSSKMAKPFINPKMEQALYNEFGNCDQVAWSKNADNTIEASIKVDGQPVQAFFNEDGEYLCSTTKMEKENLPLKLRLAMDKQFANVGISAILQKSSPEGTSYFFQGIDGKFIKIWKGTANGEIELYKKLN
jgi:hypothetical protein